MTLNQDIITVVIIIEANRRYSSLRISRYYAEPLRLVRYWDEEQKREYVKSV
jgi:hypothetical protein